MSFLRQVRAVTAVGLSSVPARLGTSMVIVVGVAAVVAVLLGALALANGFAKAAARTGSPARAIVLTGDTESDSSLPRASVVTILNAPGIRAAPGGEPIASAEMLTFIGLKDPKMGLNVSAAVRGSGPQALALHPEVKIVEGRMFARGARELVVGRALQHRLGGIAPGSAIPMPNGDWTVTGVFETGGDAHESEFMGDADMLLDANRRNVFNSITVALDGADGLQRFTTALQSNPTLTVKALREDEYFASASREVSRLLRLVARGVGGLMAFGAVFAALNTMYTAVSTRSWEIATLRSIGFGPGAVAASVLIEALLLALAGALIGALIARLLLDGSTVSAMTGISPSQITFGLRVDSRLLLTGMAIAVVVATLGGSLAAVRAARIPVADALRMV